MSDEFESLNSKLPDLESVLIQRLSQSQATTNQPNGQFDPYKAMIKKKEADTVPIDPSTIKQWPEADVKRLQEYCEKMGIIGFSAGRMHPIAALSMLKKQFGEDFTGTPMEERLPVGYEKMGTKSYGPNNTYSQTIQKKQILHG